MKDYMRLFEIEDKELGSVHTCNGDDILITLLEMFPQCTAKGLANLIEIEDLALFGTADPYRYRHIKELEADLCISVSEVI